MNNQEVNLWLRLRRSGRTSVDITDIRDVRYYERGPYTCCLVNGSRVGFAKCNPNYDTPDRDRGRAISFARALR